MKSVPGALLGRIHSGTAAHIGDHIAGDGSRRRHGGNFSALARRRCPAPACLTRSPAPLTWGVYQGGSGVAAVYLGLLIGLYWGVRTLLNLIWLIFGGLWLALGYVLAGIVACILIITIPFGIASFRMAGYALWPFGRTVISKPTAGLGSALGNVIWFIVAGFWLAIGHITTAFAQAITIIGIPLAIANVKMIPVTCFPFGKEIIDDDLLMPGTPTLYHV